MKFKNFIFVFVFLSIISFAILPIRSQDIFTYEDIPTVNVSDSTPTIFNIVSYYDNTIVIHLIRPDLSYPVEDGKLWVDKYLSLRTIYSNGNVIPIDIKLDIQDFNFCILDFNGNQASPIGIYPIRSNFLIVTYSESTNLADPFSYTDWAMVVDLNGKIYSNISFGPSFVDVASNQWVPNSAGIFVNFDPNKGFIRYTPVTNSTDTIWQQYEVNVEGEINLRAQDNIMFKENFSLISNVIPMVDSRYAIVYANSTDEATSDNPFTIRGGVYIIILENDHATKREPAVLYQTQIQGLKFTDIDCSVSYVGIGHTCIVTGKFTTQAIIETFYLKIDFLSSGTVYNVNPLTSNIQTDPLINQYVIASLPYGGYLLSGVGSSDGNNIVTGYLLGENGEFFRWELPIHTVTNFIGISKVLRNNTYVLAQPADKPYWALVTTKLNQFEIERDHGYYNFHIDTIYPNIKENISFDTGSFTILTIKYFDDIDLSTGNINIYQENGNLRQTIPGTDKRVTQSDDDGTTVFVEIIKSTLNNPGANYYISIENNFVKSRIYQEPLYGVKEHALAFTTLPEKEEFSESVSGQVRLSVEGTEYFKNHKSERKIFFTKLILELAKAIPVGHDRIFTNENFEIDTKSPQILLPIEIKKDETRTERTAKLAIEDLDYLIKNKEVTVIASGEASKYLDDIYGYHEHPGQWDTFGPGLSIAFAVLLLLTVLFFVAKYFGTGDKKDVNYFAIFQIAFVLIDFVLDLAFIITKGNNVGLFIPNVVILMVSFSLSLIIAIIIIDDESNSKNSDFEKWSNEENDIKTIFTILAGSDLEILYVLNSNINVKGFNKFNANFSINALIRIAKYSYMNIFLEDIPQLVIQIVYLKRTIHYDIIPLLTLISTCLSILRKVIGKYYIFKIKGGKRGDNETANTANIDADDMDK